MTNGATFFFMFLMPGIFLQEATASEPVPAHKPFETSMKESFDRRAAIPAAKPKLGKSDEFKPNGMAALKKTHDRCNVPGALLETAEPVGNTSGTDAHCDIVDPVKLTGVELGEITTTFSAPLTVSCEFAGVLTEWLREDVLPAARETLASPVSVITSGPGYQCRRRNNQPDGKISEHALGRAADLTQFHFANGVAVTVEDDWAKDTDKGRFLKTVHGLACGRFTTVLGPDADPNHRAHFHLDTGCHGKTCTYLICQ
ncbi:extensin family protein [Roseibium sp.]|uniref:extensin-like domain-containing protein n=1 Tax=Roseibium sp. TaxID=1936156 RepID=UPI003D0C32E0